MQSLDRHIPVIGRLFLVLFFAANSGFSVALSYCTMSKGGDDACAMAATCNEHSTPGTSHDVSVGNHFQCMVNTVAGGLQTEPTTVEKHTLNRLITKLAELPVALPVLLSKEVVDQPLTLFSSAGINVSPPSVEKYVLNETFLI